MLDINHLALIMKIATWVDPVLENRKIRIYQADLPRGIVKAHFPNRTSIVVAGEGLF
jgi:hypothetical protein